MKRMSVKKYMLIGTLVASFCMAVNGKTADQILEQRGISPTSLYGLGIRFAAFTAIAVTWPITVIKNIFGLFN